jgi:hypothetical protein
VHRRLSSTISRSKAHRSPYRRWYVRLPKGVDRRTIFVADAHRDDGKRFIVRADEKADSVSRTRIGNFDRAGVQSSLGFLGYGIPDSNVTNPVRPRT